MSTSINDELLEALERCNVCLRFFLNLDSRKTYLVAETAVSHADAVIANARSQNGNLTMNAPQHTTITIQAQRQIAIVWSVEDVQSVRPDLTDEQAFEVLEQVKHKHDATLGVTWDTLDFWADFLFPNVTAS